MIKKESILKGGILISLFNFLGKILGFVSILVITKAFGANDKTDIFYLMLSFSTLLVAVFLILQTSVFLPLFIKIKTQSGNRQAWEFSNSFFTYSFLIGLLFSLLFMTFPVKILNSISHLGPLAIDQSKNVIVLFAPIILLFIATEHLRTIINSLHHFSFPAFMIFFNNLIVVLFLVIFSKQLGPISMSLSLLASYLFQFVWMINFVVRKIPEFGISFKIVKEYGEFFKLGYPLIISQVLGSISAYFFDYTATTFSQGTLTAISYAQRMYNLPIEMIVLPISSVVVPYFSGLFAKNDKNGLLDQYIKYNNLLWFIIVPISFVLFIFSGPIIEIILKRGMFTSDDALISSISLKILALGLFGASLVALNSKVMWIIQKTFLPSLISSLTCILNVVLVYFVSAKTGYIGIPISRTLSVLFFGIVPAIIFSKMYFEQFSIKSLIIPLLYIVSMSSIASLTSFLAYEFFFKFVFHSCQNLFFNILSLFISLALFGIVYLSISFIFRIKEFEMIKQVVHEKYKQLSIFNRIKME